MIWLLEDKSHSPEQWRALAAVIGGKVRTFTVSEELLTAMAEEPRPTAVVTSGFPVLFHRIQLSRALLYLQSWLADGVVVVSIADGIDTSRPEDRAAWLAVLPVIERLHRSRLSQIANSRERDRERLRRGNRDWLKPNRRLLNPLEVAAVWHSGATQSEALAKLAKSGAKMAKSTYYETLKILDRDGQLDPRKRLAAIERRRDLSPRIKGQIAKKVRRGGA